MGNPRPPDYSGDSMSYYHDAPSEAHRVPVEFEWRMVRAHDDGTFSAVLEMGGAPIFESPSCDGPTEALVLGVDIFANALQMAVREASGRRGDIMEIVDGDDQPDEDEDEDDDPLDMKGFEWCARWAEDLREGSEVQLVLGHSRARGRILQIRRGRVSPDDGTMLHPMIQMDDTIYIIWACMDDDCEGHHYNVPPRAPVWIGTPKAKAPETSEDIPTGEP